MSVPKFLTLSAIIFLPFISRAQQDIRFGISMGANFSDFYIYEGAKFGEVYYIPAHGGPLPAWAVNASAYMEKNILKPFVVRAGIMYNGKKAREYNSLDEYGKADFISVFSTLLYRPFTRSPIRLEAGIASEFVINRSETFNNQQDYVWDFPIIIGIEADIFQSWSVTARLLEPLSYINKVRIDDELFEFEKSRVFQFSLHYKFRISQ